jgi:hypothetical protein
LQREPPVKPERENEFGKEGNGWRFKYPRIHAGPDIVIFREKEVEF